MRWWARRARAAHLALTDSRDGNTPVDLPLSVLFGKPPRMHRESARVTPRPCHSRWTMSVAQALERVLRLPSVAARVSW
jgi:phosphoribosylformylglycinamidine synthase